MPSSPESFILLPSSLRPSLPEILKSNRSIDISMDNELNLFLGLVMAALILASQAAGACYVGGCSGGEESWTESAQSFISSDVPLVGLSQSQSGSTMTTGTTSFRSGQPANADINSTTEGKIPDLDLDYAQAKPRTDSFPDSSLLKPIQTVSDEELALDVSANRSSGEARIKGAIHLPWNSFVYENGTPRSNPELAAILGQAGISEKDRLIVYSDSFSSGEAAFVLWALRLLGQENIKALDGGLEDWIAASQPLETQENTLPAATYLPRPRPELLSNYEYVKSGDPQLVDLRTFQDFGESRIPGAIFVDPDELLENGRLKEAGALKMKFDRLNASRPVVVYSNDLLNSSLGWYALQLMGFDSRIYSWQDWQSNEAVISG